MTDHYAQCLQDFDPFEGKPPDYRASDFAEVLSQARKFLAKRQLREVHQAVSDLDKAIERVKREDAHAFIQTSYSPGTQTDYSYEYRLNEVFLRHYLPDKTDKKHFTPKEYCAALAIAIIASTRPELHIRMLLREMLATSSTRREEEYAAFADKQLLLAQKALRIGKEFSRAYKRITKTTKTTKTTKRQDTNKLDPRKQLKLEFIDFYLAGTYASKSDAARKFHKKLPKGKRGLISQTDENIVRFYTAALREHIVKKK